MKKYYKFLWKEITMRLLFHIIYMCAIAALPYVIKNMIDCGFHNGSRDVVKWVGIFVIFVVIGMAAQYVTQKNAWKLDKSFYKRIRQDYFTAVINKLPEDYAQKEIGEYSSVINNDIAGCEEYIEYTMEICESVIGLAVYAVYIFMLDIRIAVIIYAVAVLTLFLPRITGRKLSGKKKQLLTDTGRYTNTLIDLLKGFSFINHFTESNISKRHKEYLDEMEQSRYEFGKYKTFANVLNGSVMYIVNTAAFAIIAVLLCAGSITAGVAAATISYIQDFMYPLRTIIDSVSAVKSVTGVKDGVISEIESRRTVPFCAMTFETGIAMKDVSIKLDKFQLSNQCFYFEKGKSYVFTGKSGTGKSTAAKLVAQKITQDSGEILIDGVEASYDLCNELIFYLEQNSYVYAQPYQDNATMFDSYAYERIIDRLAGDARYESIYGAPDCSALSGGEKQLVLISRAIMSGRDILVLDEPFSAMNSELEMHATRELLKTGRTIIMVTHNSNPEYLNLFDEKICF